ncbi:hypothetical protein [Kitasatospora terrestris]|uniref:Uncharacterized protein n=1 Tax=Kitasatospora terrestris TaxID=258051 RepID=A0ABP9EQP7_9ACTN
MSLLDVLPDEFTPLTRVTSRGRGMRIARLLGRSLSVREWLVEEGEAPDRP